MEKEEKTPISGRVNIQYDPMDKDSITSAFNEVALIAQLNGYAWAKNRVEAAYKKGKRVGILEGLGIAGLLVGGFIIGRLIKKGRTK